MSDNEIVGEFLVESYENLDKQSADRSATDDDQLGGLNQHLQIAVLHQVAAQNGADHHDDSYNHEHIE